MKIPAPLFRFALIAALSATIATARADHVDDVITAQMRKRHIPGVALAVIQERRIIREQSYGFADEENKVPVYVVDIISSRVC
jgi:CubicO group peptidase (beta-lactamase class C family)